MSDTRRTQEPETLPSEVGVPADAAPPIGAPADESAPDGAARPSVAPRATGWREEALGTAAVTLIVGIWLIVSPGALGYGQGDATWNPVAGGVLAVVLSLGRILGSWRDRVPAILLFALGAWLAISAFLLEAPIGGQWNQALMGGIVALISIVGLAGAQRGTELNPS